MSGEPLSFVVFCPPYDANSGGSVVLHLLCHLLNQNGERAYLWPIRSLDLGKKRSAPRALLRSIKLFFRYRITRFPVGPGLDTPIARRKHLRHAVVVYPEIVRGNPLGAAHVVRWLLHRPGFHTGNVDYGAQDLFFAYQKAFDDAAVTGGRCGILMISYVLDGIYKQVHFGARTGSCYILRKGKGRPIVHDLSDSTLVDDLPHERMAEVFNRVESCYCYDMYTMYAVYAALCGCKVIVVPEPGLAKEAWQPVPELRYGLAYGIDDLPEAERTRPLLLGYFKKKEAENAERVRRFASECRRHFGLADEDQSQRNA